MCTVYHVSPYTTYLSYFPRWLMTSRKLLDNSLAFLDERVVIFPGDENKDICFYLCVDNGLSRAEDLWR